MGTYKQNENEEQTIDLTKIRTCILAKELAKRKGVKEFWINVEDHYSIISNEHDAKDDGPALILVVVD